MNKIIKKVAKNNGISQKDVAEEIKVAINIAIENSKDSKESEEFWDSLLKNGKYPSPEKVINAIAKKIIANK